MSEKPEWELIDSPQSRQESNGYHHGSQGNASQGTRPSPALFLQALLGKWWLLKLVGAGVAAFIALALLIMIGGMLVLTVSAIALVSFCTARLALWLRGKQLGSKTHMPTRYREPWQQ
ncbi:hypothetical protein [Noviherbaspirillum aerium]|uniref:hypothetical protein n=1 Tax=Noviherbaspirillum aerium TaxID=2588497 RepID=UPI00124C116C|nr:hypothetical protein [Noviherbaspirillum aerium]